jgi:transposase
VVDLTARFYNPVTSDENGLNDCDLTECDETGPTTSRSARQKQRRLEEQEILRLVAGYLSGQSVPQLVESWGVHRTTVLAHLERRGVPRRRNTRKLTDDQVSEAARRYRQGDSLDTVAAHFGVSQRTIGRELKTFGVVIRVHHGQ